METLLPYETKEQRRVIYGLAKETFTNSPLDKLAGLCKHISVLVDGHVYISMNTMLPELWLQKPASCYGRTGYWWQVGTKRGRELRINALERAIELCNNEN